MIVEKMCPKCGHVKGRSEFCSNRANKDGLHVYCRPCHSENVAAAKRRNPSSEKRRMRRYYETPRGRAVVLRTAAKRRKGDGLFSVDWLESKIRAGRCEVTGIEFDLSRPESGSQNPLAPSIDRIDSSLGYTEGNVQVVLFAFNAFKAEMRQEQALELLRKMARAICQ